MTSKEKIYKKLEIISKDIIELKNKIWWGISKDIPNMTNVELKIRLFDLQYLLDELDDVEKQIEELENENS